jgi:hypothetical protein
VTPPDGNGWNRYEERVLHELQDLKEEQRELRREMSAMRQEIAALKVKAGIWGGLAGTIPFALFIAARLMGGE